MDNSRLSQGCIKSILDENNPINPIVKVLSIKPINNEDTKNKKYRLSIFDGINTNSLVMLGASLNNLVDDSSFHDGTVIRLNEYILKPSKDKKIIVLLNISILDEFESVREAPSNEPIFEPMGEIKRRKLNEPKPKSQIPNIKAMPINLINAYQNKWTIEGRVSQKDGIKTYNNAKGEGKLFSFIICDTTCDVKIVAFNNEATKFFDLIQMGKTYSISRGVVKMANAKFNKTKCEYEITLTTESEIFETQDNADIPQMLFEFVSIGEIGSRQPDSLIDVVGVAHTISETNTFVQKTTNRESKKREVHLIDRSGLSVRLTLWGEHVNLVNNLEHPVIVVKAAIVKEFNGRNLSCGNSSTVLVNPMEVEEAMSLLAWYNDGGHAGSSFQPLSGSGSAGGQIEAPTTTLLAISSSADSDKGDYFSLKATVTNVKRDGCVYKACQNGNCNKKLVDLGNGTYQCDKCNTNGTDFSYRLILNMQLADPTGDRWVTCFQNTAELVLARSAQEIGDMFELERKEELDEVFKAALIQEFRFKLRAKNETYNDETRLKIVAVDCRPLDSLEELRTGLRLLATE